MNAQPTNKYAYFALTSVSFFWGTTYFFIKIGGEYLPPFFFSGFRHLIAGAIMLFYFILIKKIPIPDGLTLLKLLGLGITLILGANVLLIYSEQYISSGLAALICAFLPFNILIINLITGNSEKLSLLSILGFALGIIGMLVIFYDSLAEIKNPEYLPGIILVSIGNFSWAIGTVLTKKAKIQLNPFYAAAWQFVLAGSVIFLLSFIFDDWNKIEFNTTSVGALSYLIVFGSIIGYGSFAYTIAHLPANVSSIYAYINPIVAVTLGFIFLNEQITWYTVLAMVITLLGVYLVNRGYKK
ncbi:MAG: EamA family transporter [Bacteroidota bacterium]|nr:EamA family transporter [Bacteroidota bacterium]